MSDGSTKKKQLGRILLKRKLLTPQELDRLLAEQRKVHGPRLASSAAENGVVADVDLLKALSEQNEVPALDLSQVLIPLSNLKVVPAELARSKVMLPVIVTDEKICLAMADPTERRTLDEIEFVTGRQVIPYVALFESLSRVIDYAYRAADEGKEYYVGAFVPDEQLHSLGITRSGEVSSRSRSEKPVIQIQQNDDAGTVVFEAGSGPLEAIQTESVGSLAPSKDPSASLHAAPTPFVPRTILVTDGSSDNRLVLKEALELQGYRVLETSSGAEAIQRLRRYVPSLIIIEMMARSIHGLDLCRRIRSSRRYGHIPVVLLKSARQKPFPRSLWEHYGISDILDAPVDVSQVIIRVGELIEKVSSAVANPDDLSKAAEEALTCGIDAYNRGNLDSAIAYLQHGIEIDPLGFRLHYHLGLLYGRLENFSAAVSELESAVDLKPENFSAIRNLAVLYQKMGLADKAMSMWERALAMAPDSEVRQGIEEHLLTLL